MVLSHSHVWSFKLKQKLDFCGSYDKVIDTCLGGRLAFTVSFILGEVRGKG